MVKHRQNNAKISLRAAVLLVIGALVIEYLLLESPAWASTRKYLASQAAAGYRYKNLVYNLEGYSISLDLLEDTKVHVTPDKGEELLFNVYFINDTPQFRGYIQLWRLEDLEHFLTSSRYLSLFDFISYSMTNLPNAAAKGFKTEWSADFGDRFVSGQEFWWSINNSDHVIRLSFFCDTKDFPEKLIAVIQHIVDSVKVESTAN